MFKKALIMCLVLGEVDKKNKRMLEAEEANIQVVPESFLQESMAGNAIENITSLNIADWGSDVRYEITNNMFLHTEEHLLSDPHRTGLRSEHKNVR